MTARSIVVRTATALAVVSLLGAPAVAADPSFPLGSRIGLVAPGAMMPSKTLRGFEDRDTLASMLVLELPPQAYAEVEKQMSPAALTSQGMTDETRETVTLKSGTGLLIVGQQVADNKKVRKWILLASTSEASALIAAQVPEDATAKYPDADMRAALLSMTVRPSVPIDEQLGLIPISLTDLSGMHAFRVIPNNAVFLTDGPKDLMEATEQPVLVISVAPGGPEQANDRENFARNMFTGLTDFKDVRIVGRDVLRLDNQQTYEIQAEAKDAKTDTPMKLVQWVRFGGGAFIRFVGVARADAWTGAFTKFRAVRDGVKPRG
jgi:hypothetical protein